MKSTSSDPSSDKRSDDDDIEEEKVCIDGLSLKCTFPTVGTER